MSEKVFDVLKINIFTYFVLLFIINLRFGILLTVCTTLEDLSCKLTNLVYFTQATCFTYTDHGFLELPSGPRHNTTRHSTGYVDEFSQRVQNIFSFS